MIADKIENAFLYYPLNEKIKIALKYLAKTDFSSLEPGKYAIDEDNIFAIVSTYQTKPFEEAKTENHKNYIDVQFIFRGRELMGYAPFTHQQPSVEYNPDKDVTFYSCDVSLIRFEADSFAIFFPDDIHTPGVAIDEPGEVTKVVVKVRV